MLVNAHCCILTFLPSNFSAFHFIPSGSILSSGNERSLNRKPLLHRLLSPDIIWYILCVLYTTVPLLFCGLGDKGGSLFLLSGATIKLLECARYAAVPVIYMAFPPTMPIRTELVEIDEKGVQRPKRWARETNNNNEGDHAVAWSDLAEVLIVFMCDWW